MVLFEERRGFCCVLYSVIIPQWLDLISLKRLKGTRLAGSEGKEEGESLVYMRTDVTRGTLVFCLQKNRCSKGNTTVHTEE